MKNELSTGLRKAAGIGSLVGLLLLACAQASARVTDGAGLEASEAASRFGTAVWLTDRCPSKSQIESPALLAPLVAIGAEFLIGRVSSALKARTEGLTGQFIARGGSNGGLQLPNSGGNAGCLIIGRGLMGAGTYRGTVKGTTFGGLDVARLNGLGFVDYPAFYAEISITRTAQGETESVVFEPVFVTYAATSAPNAGTKQKEVSIVVALSPAFLKDKAAIEGDNPIAVFRHDLGKLQIGSYYRDVALKGTSASQSIATKNLQAGLNVAALVTESEDASVALQALTTAFDDHKSDLQDAVEKALGKLIGLPEDSSQTSDNKSGKGGNSTGGGTK